MNAKKPAGNYGEGRLPAMAPLANPYVPFQIEGPVRYEPRKAMVRGTLYPGLDLPFMGMVNQNNLPVTPLSEVQVLAFAVQELALYLDTHPEDTEIGRASCREALELYRQYQQLYQKVSQAYEREKRPLNHAAPGRGVTSAWLDDPWLWEYAANKGE